MSLVQPLYSCYRLCQGKGINVPLSHAGCSLAHVDAAASLCDNTGRTWLPIICVSLE